MVREKLYYFRGMIERITSRGRGCWVEGYSGIGNTGGILYPWEIRQECQREARAEGKIARFVKK